MIRKALRNPRIVTLMAVVGFTALGIQAYRAIPKQPKHSPLAPVPAATAPAAASKSHPGSEEVSIDLTSINWVTPLERNPFQPAKALLETSGTENPGKAVEVVPKLSAIWIQGESRWAVLNGRVVGVGDAVQPWKVKAIYPDRVVVDGPRGELTIPFGERAR